MLSLFIADMFSIGATFFVLVYFLPIYFQAVQAQTTEESGVRNVALVVATSECHAHLKTPMA